MIDDEVNYCSGSGVNVCVGCYVGYCGLCHAGIYNTKMVFIISLIIVLDLIIIIVCVLSRIDPGLVCSEVLLLLVVQKCCCLCGNLVISVNFDVMSTSECSIDCSIGYADGNVDCWSARTAVD